MCKTDYGGGGGGKNVPKNDYVICERPLSGKIRNPVEKMLPKTYLYCSE